MPVGALGYVDRTAIVLDQGVVDEVRPALSAGHVDAHAAGVRCHGCLLGLNWTLVDR